MVLGCRFECFDGPQTLVPTSRQTRLMLRHPSVWVWGSVRVEDPPCGCQRRMLRTVHWNDLSHGPFPPDNMRNTHVMGAGALEPRLSAQYVAWGAEPMGCMV